MKSVICEIPHLPDGSCPGVGRMRMYAITSWTREGVEAGIAKLNSLGRITREERDPRAFASWGQGVFAANPMKEQDPLILHAEDNFGDRARAWRYAVVAATEEVVERAALGDAKPRYGWDRRRVWTDSTGENDG